MGKRIELTIAVMLPAFNEEVAIESTIREFYKELPSAQYWVIDNNSSDRTASVSKAAIEGLGVVGGVIFEPRQGKGYALRTGLLSVDADVFVIVDADLTYVAGDVHKLLTPVLEGRAEMCVGDRHSSGEYQSLTCRPLHVFGNRLVCSTINLLFDSNLSDVMSGYRVLTRRFVRSCSILANGFEIETEITVHALDKRLLTTEVPVRYRNRPSGSASKLNTISDGFRILWTIFNIFRFYRPFVFFGSISLILLLIGIFVAIPVLVGYLQTGLVLKLPSALLSTGLILSSLISFFGGLILDSIALHEKRRFERDLYNSQGHRS